MNGQVGSGGDIAIGKLLKDDCCVSAAQSTSAHILPAQLCLAQHLFHQGGRHTCAFDGVASI